MTTFIAPTAFRTEEFTLRSYVPEDAEILNRATLASYEHLKTFMPWATNTQTLEEARALTTAFRGRWLLATDFVIACVAPDGSELLGGCGYHLREGPIEEGRAELGVWVSAAHAGRGLGTQILGAMLLWGFTEWPWRRLSWRCDSRNVASARVAEKNGLRLEGREVEYRRGVDATFVDDLAFAILKREWIERRGSASV